MKTISWKTKFISAVVILAIIFALFPTMSVHAEGTSTSSNTLSLKDFSATLRKSDSSLLTGLYIDDVMAVPVLQQPSSNPGYVSSRAESVTQFGLASQYGSIGLLAHNYLSGNDFFNIQSGSLITLVYGDGSVKYYQVSDIRKYQALSPNSQYSNFKNLANPDVTLTSTDLFYETYGLGNVLVLQTCILANGDPSWGRIFIIATPYEETPDLSYLSYSFLEAVHTM
ncbi:MAG: hypothetical protein FD147_620 [Chloroflexi bacterium]|nr:MAG: hypothetical protein FD147_620 [Chloroflexota bacterium]MBA4375575.1 hypothetical protein [Anaerolinea sp.]